MFTFTVFVSLTVVTCLFPMPKADWKTGKRTREACADLVGNLPKRCREEGADYTEAVQEMGGVHQTERSLRRHRQKELPAIDNWHEIPEVYRVTRSRGRTDDFGAAEYRGETWLKPIPEEHEMLLFINVGLLYYCLARADDEEHVDN